MCHDGKSFQDIDQGERDEPERQTAGHDQAGHQAPDKEAARVTHEYAGRVFIVEEEAQEGAGCGGGYSGISGLTGLIEQHRQGGKNLTGCAGRQPIHTIVQIDGIGGSRRQKCAKKHKHHRRQCHKSKGSGGGSACARQDGSQSLG